MLLQQTIEDTRRKIKHIIYDLQVFSKQSFTSNSTNNASLRTRTSETYTDIFYNSLDHTLKSWASFKDDMETGFFGVKDTSVYMSLSHNYCRHQTLGTQATASINKSFQVCDRWKALQSEIDTASNYCSTSSVSTDPFHKYKNGVSENLLQPEIYFFGKKKERSDNKGMGSKTSQSKLHKTSQTSGSAVKSGSKSSIQSSSNTSVKKRNSAVAISKSKSNCAAKSKGAATSSCKSVTIKDDKSQKPCPALAGTTKGDMSATVSHIKIGPKENCPVHGSDPCQGPKCVLASSGQEQGLVKVTNINNPRKGVFEIVIRKLTGAPLAKNELMLEWTPPPSRPLPCNAPCPISYITPRSCRHSKCKLVVCKPSPCRPKCSRKKPCAQISCRTLPCKNCCKATCCGSPCRPCKPCPPQPCCPVSSCGKCIQPCKTLCAIPCKTLCAIPCKTSCATPCKTACAIPCKTPCAIPCKTPCAIPCKSSPCLKPCPIGRKKPRISRSQPKIKSHRKKLSPCYNRSKACPIVRCRSIAGPCTMYCGIRPFCIPPNCSTVLPCKSPSLESCIKSCSSCCG